MTDTCCWISSTDSLPLTDRVCPVGHQQLRRIDLPFLPSEFPSAHLGMGYWPGLLEDWAKLRGLQGRWCGWDGAGDDGPVFEVLVTRDQIEDFCSWIRQEYAEAPEDDVERFRVFISEALDPLRTYTLSADTF